jgi:soluble lytic murein transglycosylase-like protein
MKKTPYLIAPRAYAACKGTLAAVGLVALAGLYMQPEDRVDHTAHTTAGTIKVSAAQSALEREKRAVTEFIARRYRVADEAVFAFVTSAYDAGATHSVDPLLILAVMAIESRYNPVAESWMGAKGLMQVIPKYHPEKLSDHGGEHALLNPRVNITVGTQILREYTRRFGDIQSALQAYAGAFDEPTAQYANKVFAEKARLEVLRQRAKKPQSA